MKFKYQCVNCKSEYDNKELIYLCPKCEKENKKNSTLKGVLKVIYNYDELKKREFEYFDDIINIWPIDSMDSLSHLDIGNTPIYSKEYKDNNLFFKMDALNPTYSFKDRASDLVCAIAVENGIDTVITASTGNAASSLAGLAAAYGIKSILFVPKSAPKAKLLQSAVYGGNIIPIDGTYDDAFDLSIEASKKFGWYNRNTAYNPFTIEGKKSVSIEIFIQFMNSNIDIPSTIFVPVGDGVIISGVYKGFEDLLLMEKIDKMPKIIAVQAKGSNNIISNLKDDEFSYKNASTVADSISVDIPRNFHMAKDFINTYNGEGIEVTDKEIMDASLKLGRKFGLFVEPAAATAFAGFEKYTDINSDIIDEDFLVLLTGSGLKDINSIEKLITLPKPIKKLEDINILEDYDKN